MVRSNLIIAGSNFIFLICKIKRNWSSKDQKIQLIKEVKDQVGGEGKSSLLILKLALSIDRALEYIHVGVAPSASLSWLRSLQHPRFFFFLTQTHTYSHNTHEGNHGPHQQDNRWLRHHGLHRCSSSSRINRSLRLRLRLLLFQTKFPLLPLQASPPPQNEREGGWSTTNRNSEECFDLWNAVQAVPTI